jgi:hypothetical protein
MSVQSGFMVDGKFFATKAEANDFVARPKKVAALNKIKGSNTELVGFLIDHQDDLEGAFESGKSRRVLKTERNKLSRALKYIADTLKDDHRAAMVLDNVEQIAASFKWPAVKKMEEAEQAATVNTSILAIVDGNQEVATWVIANKDAILEGFEAGVEKRVVSEKTMNALAAAREKLAAAKAERLAKEAAAGEKKAA